MQWPTPQDFNEALQNPHLSFSDPDLAKGKPAVNVWGLPTPATGAFASVYKLVESDRHWAVRCFLRPPEDLQPRYEALTDYLGRKRPQHTVFFRFLPQGIKIRTNWFPILKMAWLDGLSLETFISNNISNQTTVSNLAAAFRSAVADLNGNGIAHGDLQHGNIIIQQNGLRLVDYDGMFVPPLAGRGSNELGHPNYQHPFRRATHFGPFLDNFSSHVIYGSLLCLSMDPELWKRLAGGDECLIFRKPDFANPLCSYAFSALEHHSFENIRTIGRHLRALLSVPPEDIPMLGGPLPATNDLEELPPPDELAAPSAIDTPVPSINNVVRAWPRREYYEQAVLQPSMFFKDREIKRSQYTFEHGAGKFGVVFRLHNNVRPIAVKCFFKEQTDRQTRYDSLKRALKEGAGKGFLLDVDYDEHAISYSGSTYPVLKMDWAPGMTLDRFFQELLGKKTGGTKSAVLQSALQKMDKVIYQYRMMVQSLYAAGIAHGDLSHTNIIVSPEGNVKLIDYDGMFVPAIRHLDAAEFGESIYQHPGRTLKHFGPDMDNFAAWILDTALTILRTYPDAYLGNWTALMSAARSGLGPGINCVYNSHLDASFEVVPTAEIMARNQLIEKMAQMPFQNVPRLIPDFSSNLLKRNAILEQANKILVLK